MRQGTSASARRRRDARERDSGSNAGPSRSKHGCARAAARVLARPGQVDGMHHETLKTLLEADLSIWKSEQPLELAHGLTIKRSRASAVARCFALPRLLAGTQEPTQTQATHL